MTNNFMTNLIADSSLTTTMNGATALSTTGRKLYDLFALGGAYRNRPDTDCLELFFSAYKENPLLALRCLFYLRDAREGQGERRFFRVCMTQLARKYPKIALKVLDLIPYYGRWDDLYCFVDTPVETEAFNFMREQLICDIKTETPSLLAKWLKSINTSSAESRKLAKITCEHFGLTAKKYRKTLSILRGRIKIVEKLMSEGKWNEIKFDALPSKAGMKYRHAFAKHEYERYNAFINSKETKVNTKTLYPYEVVRNAAKAYTKEDLATCNKYWENLRDYFAGASLNAICMVDTSGSMTWGTNITPMDVAVSLGLYCAERNSGPFANYYVSFASRPRLVFTGNDNFCAKVKRIYHNNLCDNTNLEAAFDLLLGVAVNHKCKQEDIPAKLIVISDMQIDEAVGHKTHTLDMDTIRHKWRAAGYKCPDLVYWNVNASQDTILDNNDGSTFVSGFSASIFEQILKNKNGIELMMEILNSKRYSVIC